MLDVFAIGANMPLPTPHQIRRIDDGIKETNRLIAKEEKYSKDLQKVDYLKSLYVHLNRLYKMRDTGEGLPK
jgi:hypothetical protein